jgi:16S rRNA (guanine1516-N2)-methyltransferase
MQQKPNTHKSNSGTATVRVVADYSADGVSRRCRDLAAQCGIALIEQSELSRCTSEQLLLTWIDDALTLCQGPRFELQTRVDFASGKSLHRIRYGGGTGQPLARAARINTTAPAFICDATGGIGRDAFVFATLGSEVVILEKSPVVYALLVDGLRRALQHPDINPIASRMEVHCIDSKTLPDSWPHNRKPDTVYLDPMYPHERRKSAAKKEMQLLQGLQLDEPDESALLHGAIDCAVHRVAVKRPLNAKPIAGIVPSGTIKSTNTRYDIYAGRAQDTPF